MMKPEIKTKWVEALRSGDYKQGFRDLKIQGRHCCLGVLTELYCSDKQKRFRNNNAGLPSKNVKDWAGLNERNPTINYHDMMHKIADLNDVVGLDFKELADLIEEQL